MKMKGLAKKKIVMFRYKYTFLNLIFNIKVTCMPIVFLYSCCLM